MLLSSTAEAMYWTGRYFERAQTLARVIQGHERLALDLPATEALELGCLLPLVGSEPPARSTPSSLPDLLHTLVLDTKNPSSVRGALERARENLRSGRTVMPPAVWAIVNGLHAQLGELEPASSAAVFAALDAVERAGSELSGELDAGMTRDSAYSFFRIGRDLEHADLLLRTLVTLLPALTESSELDFADVRWMGLLQCVGAHSMYRRSHHTRVDLSSVLHFVVGEPTFPRSVAHAVRALESQIDRLPRPGTSRMALAACNPEALVATFRGMPSFLAAAHQLIRAFEELGDTLMYTYFPPEPKQSGARASLPQPDDRPNPFERLGREHAAVEAVLRVLDELVARNQCGSRIARGELRAIVGFFTDFGVLGHHEKEESILMPALLEAGFAWDDGPLATMRRDHRQEHYFLRVLTHLGDQTSDWSEEDRRRFTSVTQEFTGFLRAHMRLEQHEVFEPASQRLSAEHQRALGEALVHFDADTGSSVGAAERRVAYLLEKYGIRPRRQGERLELAAAPG